MSKADQKPLEYLVRDDNNVAVPIGSDFVTQDASGTPKTSPLAYTGTEIAITVPDRAVEMVLAPSTALRVSEVTGMARYYVIPTGTAETLPCARMQTIYIKQDSAGGSLNFRFIQV